MAETMNVNATTTETEDEAVTAAEVHEALTKLEEAISWLEEFQQQLTKAGLENEMVDELLSCIDSTIYGRVVDQGGEYRFWAGAAQTTPSQSAVAIEAAWQAANADDDEFDDDDDDE